MYKSNTIINPMRSISSARIHKPVTRSQTVMRKSTTIQNPTYIMVIDTETTGLFQRNANPENFELFNTARMVEIAWDIYTPSGDLISRESYIIKPDGFTIPQTAINIHGITNELAESIGVHIENVFERLEIVLKDVAIIVAHNLSYDNAIILAELYRLNDTSNTSNGISNYRSLLHDWLTKERKCTMLMSTHITGVYKWHKLGELYRICFNSAPDITLHRAAADVDICSKIYFHLVQRTIRD